MFWYGLTSWPGLNGHVEADGGCIGEVHLKVKCPVSMSVSSLFTAHEIQDRVHIYLETANKRFKQWCVLTEAWLYDMRDDSTVFYAITILTQLTILNRELLFVVDYEDHAP